VVQAALAVPVDSKHWMYAYKSLTHFSFYFENGAKEINTRWEGIRQQVSKKVVQLIPTPEIKSNEEWLANIEAYGSHLLDENGNPLTGVEESFLPIPVFKCTSPQDFVNNLSIFGSHLGRKALYREKNDVKLFFYLATSFDIFV
jgi:hypothetical protein